MTTQAARRAQSCQSISTTTDNFTVNSQSQSRDLVTNWHSATSAKTDIQSKKKIVK